MTDERKKAVASLVNFMCSNHEWGCADCPLFHDEDDVFCLNLKLRNKTESDYQRCAEFFSEESINHEINGDEPDDEPEGLAPWEKPGMSVKDFF